MRAKRQGDGDDKIDDIEDDLSGDGDGDGDEPETEVIYVRE
jgi:hypothetical protein